MNKTTRRHTLAVLSLLSIGSGALLAQTPPAPADNPASPDQDQGVVALDPFTVSTDNEGYQAVDTLGGARVRTKLADTPSALSVVTTKFMQDLSITNAQDLLIYTTDTEVAGLGGNFSGVSTRGFGVVGAAEGSRLANPGAVNRARGLTAMDNTRNYFQSQIPWDGYNISRVDISRGPNSFLFGVGSPSGISNVSTNDASFKDKGSVESRFGSFGSSRESLDYNKVLLASELAIRVDAVDDQTKFQQKPAFNHSERLYGALRYDPKFLSTPTSHLKLQANYESGRVESNNPRELPPMDYITGYFNSGVNKTGYNPWTYVAGSAGYDPAATPWSTNNDIHYAWANNATYWYDASSGTLLNASQGGAGGLRADGSAIAGLNGVSNAYHLYTVGFAQYTIAANSADPTLYPGANARTVNYLDKTLTDPSIYDFYNKLIDGPNKHEWQRWNAYNVNAVESLFNDRLTLQAIVDHQKYNRGQEGILTGYLAPYISVDLDTNTLTYPTWLPGASTNPNEGRPFIGGDSAGGDNESFFRNNNYQFTAAGSLRADDFLSKNSLLARILGHHEITGLIGKYDTKEEDRSWQLYATDAQWGTASGHGLTLSENNVNWVAYLGPSLASASSASGANLSNIATRLIPTTGPVSLFSNKWTAAAGVNASDPWTNPVPTGSLTETQGDNPANYAGYQAYPTTILNSQQNINQLYTNGNKQEQILNSDAILYQGFFFDDTIIPEFGWRRDKVLQRGDQAPISTTTGVASMNYNLDDPGVVIRTTSKSYGIAVHLPKSVKQHLPEGTDVTLYYFHGSNQTPRVRYGIDGSMLPNETGKTDDYSIQFDGLNGHATLRLGFFRTVDNNATASSGQPLGSQGWLIDSLPSWTLTFAAAGAAAANNPTSSLPADMQGNSWIWSWAQTNPALANQIAASVQKEFPVLFPQSYWDQYGLPVNVAAIQAGDWLHILKGGLSPLTWNINNQHIIHGVVPTIDQNLVSKGNELEATIRPVSNWDITFNASRVNAYQTSLGADAANYLNGLANVWLNTPVGLTPQWGSVTSPVSQLFLSGLWAPYLTQVALTGTDQPELRKWNFKFITNYTFEHGFAKGLNIGGAFRWASRPILGYGIKQSTVFGNEAWIADVSKPLYGTADSHFDAWIGYQHKLNAKIDWRIQLNLKNVGEKAHLTPVSVEPDGSWAQERIEDGQTFELSNKFFF